MKIKLLIIGAFVTLFFIFLPRREEDTVAKTPPPRIVKIFDAGEGYGVLLLLKSGGQFEAIQTDDLERVVRQYE